MSRIKYHNGTDWVYADMAVQVGGVSYDLNVDGTFGGEGILASDVRAAITNNKITALKTMDELLAKLRNAYTFDISGGFKHTRTISGVNIPVDTYDPVIMPPSSGSTWHAETVAAQYASAFVNTAKDVIIYPIGNNNNNNEYVRVLIYEDATSHNVVFTEYTLEN